MKGEPNSAESFTTSESAAVAKALINMPVGTMINRDLSLVEFYWRVLEEALDAEIPLLERVKFIGIVASLIDEFFMIRVAGLKAKSGAVMEVTPDGLTASQQLDAVRERLQELITLQYSTFRDVILPKLKAEGIVLTSYDSLKGDRQQGLTDYFSEKVYPVLTPQAVDPSHPFPYISGGSLNFALVIQPKLNRRVARALKNSGKEFFVRMKIPPFLPRLIQVKPESSEFVLMEDLIAANISLLIPEAGAGDCHFFRITRDADLEVHESEAADLLEAMEENLRLRRFGDVTRMEISNSMPDEMRAHLAEKLEIGDEDIFVVDGPSIWAT
ncbi:MAG: hypothetical protein ABI999_03220 [Acidobacteriota bacterium]